MDPSCAAPCKVFQGHCVKVPEILFWLKKQREAWSKADTLLGNVA